MLPTLRLQQWALDHSVTKGLGATCKEHTGVGICGGSVGGAPHLGSGGGSTI